jgi:L-seryl-tRNA(Ser) seleniumtransferase
VTTPAGPDDRRNPCRDLPSVSRLIEDPSLEPWRRAVPRSLVVDAARAELEAVRHAIDDQDPQANVPGLEMLAMAVASRLQQATRPPLEPVVNATGIIIHTGLGRAPLAEPVVRALADVAGGYAPVELDMPSGERGRRSAIVRDLLCELTGAESALVVNNNAAGLLLALAAIARGREVVVSRGELIEIGGSFRLPEIMETGGAVLREVGTTNKTRVTDYERAIGERTAALLKVHTSNYRIEGFTQSVPIGGLVELGRRHGLPVIDDTGSGALRDLVVHGLASEPDARTSVRAGADLVLFSGDKILGGPQAGVVVGRRCWVERLERHPMMRALRVDKLTLAALGATLQLHRDGDAARDAVPVMRMATAPIDGLRRRAEAIVASLRSAGGIREASVQAATAYAGGGSLPAQGIPSVAVRVAATRGEQDLARRLRLERPAVLPRVQAGAVWLDLRTVFPRQDEALAAAVIRAAAP